MVSISSGTNIKNRTIAYCTNIKEWFLSNENDGLLSSIKDFLEQEYGKIPEKERIGKGTVYVSKYVAKGMYAFFLGEKLVKSNYISKLIGKIFNYGEQTQSLLLQHFALLLLSEDIFNHPDDFEQITPLIEFYANHEDWTIRESITFTIRAGLKNNITNTLTYLFKLARSKNENYRRLVSESLRPMSDIKWLRDPDKNEEVLKILTLLNSDSSLYVRKSVGNNLKDLTKYMPEKILDLVDKWITDSNIQVREDLASEEGLTNEEKRLIWTIKHAMRWLKKKKPEYIDRIVKILGMNYVLYFDEKRNRLAKP